MQTAVLHQHHQARRHAHPAAAVAILAIADSPDAWPGLACSPSLLAGSPSWCGAALGLIMAARRWEPSLMAVIHGMGMKSC